MIERQKEREKERSKITGKNERKLSESKGHNYVTKTK